MPRAQARSAHTDKENSVPSVLEELISHLFVWMPFHNSLLYMKFFSTQRFTVKVTSLGSDDYFSQIELVTLTYAPQDPEHIAYEHLNTSALLRSS